MTRDELLELGQFMELSKSLIGNSRGSPDVNLLEALAVLGYGVHYIIVRLGDFEEVQRFELGKELQVAKVSGVTVRDGEMNKSELGGYDRYHGRLQHETSERESGEMVEARNCLEIK